MPSRPKQVKSYVKNPVREAHNPVNRTDTYGPIHQALRLELLATNPICVRCKKAFAVHAHHTRYGPDITLKDYEALCEPCHHAEHKAG